MIEANELRIGNWFLNIRGEYGKIQKGEWLDTKTDWFSPIPLTPEILHKIGWVTLDCEMDIVVWGADDNSNGEEFSLVSDGLDQPMPIYFEYDLGYRDVRKEIKYVHQLQNIYFALTGKELTIDL